MRQRRSPVFRPTVSPVISDVSTCRNQCRTVVLVVTWVRILPALFQGAAASTYLIGSRGSDYPTFSPLSSPCPLLSSSYAVLTPGLIPSTASHDPGRLFAGAACSWFVEELRSLISNSYLSHHFFTPTALTGPRSCICAAKATSGACKACQRNLTIVIFVLDATYPRLWPLNTMSGSSRKMSGTDAIWQDTEWYVEAHFLRRAVNCPSQHLPLLDCRCCQATLSAVWLVALHLAREGMPIFNGGGNTPQKLPFSLRQC